MINKEKIIEIRIDLYNINVLLIICDNINEVTNKIKKTHKIRKLISLSKKKISKLEGVVIAQFIENNLIYVIIKRDINKVNIDTLTHEIFHLTNKIMKLNDFDFYENEEAFARLNGALNSMIIKKIIEFNEVFFYQKTNKIKLDTINNIYILDDK